jgi:glutaredoxin
MTKIKMVTQPDCTFCDRAEAIFFGLGLTVDKVVLNTPEKKAAFKKAGHQTVPIIYINDYLVGGHSDLVEIIRELLLSRYLAN